MGTRRKFTNEFKVEVVLPTRGGPELRRRCVTEPTKHQTILLQRLGLILPKPLKTHEV